MTHAMEYWIGTSPYMRRALALCGVRFDANLVNDKTQSPELRQFGFANLSLVNAYARAINPTGVGAQQDKEHALAVLNTGFAKGDYKAAVDQLQVEIAAELKAPSKVRQQMRENFTGGTEETQNRRATDSGAHPDVQKLLDKYK